MKLFAFTFLCLLGTVSLSQNSISYTKAEGLPTNDVYQIISASDHTLWMATENGLVNYDGYNFKVFTKKDGLSHNENFEVFENKGSIHCLGAEGGFSTGKDQEEFSHQNLFDGFISEMFFKQEMTVAASFGGGIMIMSETDTVLVGIENGLPDLHVSFIWKWEESIYCISKSGLSRVSKEGSVEVLHTFEKRIHFARGLQLEDQVIFDDGSQLFSFNKEEELTPIQIDFPVSQRIVTKVQFLDGLVFFSSYAGTHAYEFHDNELIYHSSYEADKITTSICKDYQGGYWISTLKDGVIRIHNPHIFTVLDQQTFGIAVKNNSAYVGDQNYILHEISKSELDLLPVSRNRNGAFKIRRIKFIDEYIWIENDGAIGRYDGKKTEYYRTGESVVTEFNDELIIGTAGGAFLILESDLYNICFSNVESKLIKDFAEQLSTETIHLLERTSNKVVMGTDRGVVFYDGELAECQQLPKAKVVDLDIYHEQLAVTFEDIGTYLCTSSDTFLLYASDENFGRSVCADISEEHIFIGTGSGVYCFDAQSKTKIDIHLLPNVGIRDIEVLNDDVLISTETGCHRISLDHLKENNYEIPLRILSVEVNDVEIAESLNEYHLSHNENRISVKAKAINYSSTRAKLYYSLNKGQEHEFDGNLVFMELSPGDYILNIYAKDNLQSSNQITLRFVINPPWWRTVWFRVFLTLGIIGLVWLFFRIRVLSYNRDVVREILLTFRNRIKKDRFIIVKDIKDGSKVKIAVNNVLFLQSAKNYVDIQTETGKITVRSTFKNLIQDFDKEAPGQFVRVHKSYVVNLQKVNAAHREFVKIKDLQIPIGNNFKEEIRSLTKELNSG